MAKILEVINSWRCDRRRITYGRGIKLRVLKACSSLNPRLGNVSANGSTNPFISAVLLALYHPYLMFRRLRTTNSRDVSATEWLWLANHGSVDLSTAATANREYSA
ncbi:hypothetical protein J6590_046452 [Homalodisca vitripennis]|nr:hypothetical protein J6590_046452 [Homalodisca vitripennis]